MLYQALQKAKKGEDKKVAVNIQVPATLKEGFEELCKKEGVSMTALMCALMETAVEEQTNYPFYKNNSLELVDLLEELKAKVAQINQNIDIGLDESELGFNPYDELEIVQARIQAIHIELNNRGRFVS